MTWYLDIGTNARKGLPARIMRGPHGHSCRNPSRRCTRPGLYEFSPIGYSACSLSCLEAQRPSADLLAEARRHNPGSSPGARGPRKAR